MCFCAIGHTHEPLSGQKFFRAFNIFNLSDALGRRDREKLWVLYQQALRAGLLPMDIFWKFVWQIKNMILVATSRNVAATGLKPFVANKALTASRNYSLTELERLADELANLMDQTFPESDEFNFGLEKFILTI